jgi:hypothetical protein
MKSLWHWSAALILCAFWGSAFACPQAQLVDDEGNIVRLLQRKFDGVHELVLIAGDATQQELKSRLTYDGTGDSACRFGAVAIAKGGAWGWHLAWADTENIYIVRMDGEAWVNSPPKRFAFPRAQSLKFQQNGSILQLGGASSQTRILLQTDDEGRSWTTQ